MTSEPMQTKEMIFQKLMEYMENTKDFVLENAPDVICQALKYQKISTFFSAVTMLITLVTCIMTSYYFWKHSTLDKHGYLTTSSFLGVLIPLIFVIPLSCELYCSIDKLIKIYVAPKYFLIQLFMNK